VGIAEAEYTFHERRRIRFDVLIMNIMVRANKCVRLDACQGSMVCVEN